MDSVEAEIQQLKAAVAELEARVQGKQRVETAPGTSNAVEDARHDRRRLLAKAAGGAAAAVVGGTALVLGQASPAAAAQGSFTGSPAVLGTGTGADAIGVKGVGNGSWGVYGEGQSGTAGVADPGAGGTGLFGFSQVGTGAFGGTADGIGIQSEAGPEGLHLRLSVGTKPPLTSTELRQQGDVTRDTNGDLWLCVAQGSPGQWRRIAGPSTAGALVALATPVRVYDSRPGQLPATTPKNPLAANVARTLDLKNNGSGVPAGARAVLVGLVATGTTTAIGGFMSIYRNGIGFPGTSNLNWSGPNQTVAVTTLTAVDAQSRANVYAGSVTDVVVDVLGYYL